MQLANYLYFNSTCEAALNFYAACGLGQVVETRRYGGERLRNAAMDGKIMHAQFEGPGVLFYAADNEDAEPMRGAAHILRLDNTSEARSLFLRLAIGGSVATPLSTQPSGDMYGKLTDRFGVQWIVHAKGTRH